MPPPLRYERPDGFPEGSVSNGFVSKKAIIRVGAFDPDPTEERRSELHGVLEGHCNIIHTKGRRALFFDLTMEVPLPATCPLRLPLLCDC